MKIFWLSILIGIGLVQFAGAQTSNQVDQNWLNAMQSVNSTAQPGDCAAPMATVDMMNDIQQIVGVHGINDQLVNLTDIKTILIDRKTGDWSCEVTTVWATGPAIRGVFKLYYNVNLEPVYYWNGEEEIYDQNP